MNSSLKKLVKNLLDNNFKYLTEEFGYKNLELLKQKDGYPYEYMDIISIHMIKLCGVSICKPLEIIFQNCLRSGKFPSEWKKANVVPTFKKSDKQCIKNYRPVSLLPVCAKVFERLFLNNMFSFFHKMT